MALLSGVFVNSFYRILELNFGEISFLIHLLIMLICLIIIIYIVIKIKTKLLYDKNFVMLKDYDWLKRWLNKTFRR